MRRLWVHTDEICWQLTTVVLGSCIIPQVTPRGTTKDMNHSVLLVQYNTNRTFFQAGFDPQHSAMHLAQCLPGSAHAR